MMLAALLKRAVAPPALAAPPVAPPAPPPAPALTSPPCLIMLGGLGDLLIALPIAHHYAQRFSTPTPLLTSPRYQNVLAGCSYVRSVGYTEGKWRHYTESIAWAHSHFATVYPLHVGEAEIRDNPQCTHFCHEQYRCAGVAGRYGEFPLVFDRRNAAREAALVARVRASNPRPLLLYNFVGRSSPFDGASELLASLTAKWRDRLHLVNISQLDLSHFQDLLALLSASIGMISIDTASLHLMPASLSPYIALTNDTKSPWWSSVPRGNCVLQLGYTETLPSLPLIHEVVERMVAGGVVAPVPRKAIRTLTPSVAPSRATPPHLVTIAHGEMERVWSVARQTWQPWLRSNSLTLDVTTRLPRPDLHPCWNKLPIVLDALTKHPVVWWIDADITVARPTATLPWSDADLLFLTDGNGLCAGMFRARATPWTRGFLSAVLLLGDVRDHDAFGRGCGIKWEQNAFKALLASFPSCASHIAYLPRDFATDRPMEAASSAPFAFYHFGAMSNAERVAKMRLRHNLQ